jgi:hypothetical protein
MKRMRMERQLRIEKKGMETHWNRESELETAR